MFTVGSAHGVWGYSVVRRWMMVIVGLREVHGSTVEQLFWIVHRPSVAQFHGKHCKHFKYLYRKTRHNSWPLTRGNPLVSYEFRMGFMVFPWVSPTGRPSGISISVLLLSNNHHSNVCLLVPFLAFWYVLLFALWSNELIKKNNWWQLENILLAPTLFLQGSGPRTSASIIHCTSNQMPYRHLYRSGVFRMGQKSEATDSWP